jgi:hypothetical protein
MLCMLCHKCRGKTRKDRARLALFLVLCCSMYFLCCCMYFVLLYVFFVLLYVFFVLLYVFFVLLYVFCVALCIFCVALCIFCVVCFVTFPVFFVCICVLNYCHRVTTQLQLNLSYHIQLQKGSLYYNHNHNNLCSISEIHQSGYIACH